MVARLAHSREPGNHYLTVDHLSFGLATVLTIETLDAAGGVNKLLLAGEEGVAVRTYLKTDLRLRGSRLPRLTARAMNGRGYVLRMDVWLHLITCSCYEFVSL